MRNNWFTYIKIDEEVSKVKSSGIKFNEFIKGITEKPKNILLLSGDSMYSEMNIELNLEYISSSNLENLYREDIYSFGDFCWIDFEDKNNMREIDKLELAKILYFNHTGIPFDNHLFESLNNKYVYFAHDDEYVVNTYMKNIEDYKEVINNKLLKEFKGRKKYIANIPEEILDFIYNLCKFGIIIDFEKLLHNSVYIYSIGNVRSMDEAHEKLDKYRKHLRGVSLGYDNRKKLWNIYK